MIKKLLSFSISILITVLISLPVEPFTVVHAEDGSGYISQMAVSKSEIVSGDTLSIKVKLNSLKIATSFDLIYSGPPYTYDTDIYLNYNNTSGYYEANVKLDNSFNTGLWRCSEMQINFDDYTSLEIYSTQFYSSEIYLTADLKPLGFNVHPNTVDLDMFNNNFYITTDKSNAAAAETVNYSINAGYYPDMSSEIIGGGIQLVNTDDNTIVTLPIVKGTDGKWSSAFKITDTLSNGYYEIQYAYFQFITGQTITIYNTNVYQGDAAYSQYMGGTVKVTNPVIDAQTLTASPASASPGQWVKLTVNRSKYPGTHGKPFDITYESSNQRFVKITFNLDSTGTTYEGQYFVTDYSDSGLYKPVGVSGLEGGSSIGTFTVIGKDKTPPVLTSLNINKNTFTQGETVKLTGQATDSESGVDKINVWYDSFLITLQNINGTFYGEKTFSRFDYPTTYTPTSIHAVDKAGNYSTGGIDYSKYTITLTQNPNLPAPTFNSLSINKNSFNNGEKAVFTAQMSNYAPDRPVTVELESETLRTTFDIKLYYNNGVYTGYFDLDKYTSTGKWYVSQVRYMTSPLITTIVYDKRYAAHVLNDVKDFSNCTFTVNGIDTAGYYITNGSNDALAVTTLKDTTVNGDIYVKQYHDLYISGTVKINGNLYIEGNLYNLGNLNVTGTIFARKRTSSDPAVNENGLFIDRGGSIGSSRISIGTSMMPSRLEFDTIKNSTITDVNGNYHIKGHIVPGRTLYINSFEISVDQKGYFDETIRRDSVSEATRTVDSITVKDGFGNTQVSTLRYVNSKFDINQDETIDLLDLAAASKYYNAKFDSSKYDLRSDVNKDGLIDIYDLAVISKNF